MNPILLDIPETIDGDRLTLRVPRPGWGGMVSRAATESLEELRPWMPWAQAAPKPEDSEVYCRQAAGKFVLRQALDYMVFLKDTDALIGACGFPRLDWTVGSFEIGYWLHTRHTGRGYMTEAVNRLTRFAFDVLGANRVEIHMDDRNERSWRVAERAGFVLEAVLRSSRRNLQGQLCDGRVYAKVGARAGEPPAAAP